VTTILLDSHTPHWRSAGADWLSPAATAALEDSDELAVSAISWYELAWMARHERIEVSVPVGTWLDVLSHEVCTVSISPAIANAAASLPTPFPGDPADRIIYATALEQGWRLVTRDRRPRRHGHPPGAMIR
jgi:PIN domain nuclease of toxin-antitoxin system